MKKLQEALAKIGIVLLMVAFMVGIIWWTVDVWNECRLTNSFSYCLRVLSR